MWFSLQQCQQNNKIRRKTDYRLVKISIIMLRKSYEILTKPNYNVIKRISFVDNIISKTSFFWANQENPTTTAWNQSTTTHKNSPNHNKTDDKNTLSWKQIWQPTEGQLTTNLLHKYIIWKIKDTFHFKNLHTFWFHTYPHIMYFVNNECHH